MGRKKCMQINVLERANRPKKKWKPGGERGGVWVIMCWWDECSRAELMGGKTVMTQKTPEGVELKESKDYAQWVGMSCG
jgi:hypothetical protein